MFLSVFLAMFLLASECISEKSISFTEGERSQFLRYHNSTLISIQQVPWLVVVYDHKNDKTLGMGAILTKNWVLTTAYVVNNVSTTDMLVYSDVEDTRNVTAGIEHGVAAVKIHETFSGTTKDALALIKLCPPISTGTSIDLPPRGTLYKTTQNGNVYSYGTDGLHSGSKLIGERCECELTTDWDSTVMFCLQEHPLVFGEASDISNPVAVDGHLAGFLMIPQLPNNFEFGEQVIDLSKYLDWIAVNTV